MRILKVISALLLGGIFLLSAYAKIISIEPFEIYIYQSSFLGFDMASAISRLLIAAEAVAGIFLLSRISFRLVDCFYPYSCFFAFFIYHLRQY